MSRRLRLIDVKPIVGRVLGIPQSDSRIPDYVSRAQERLLYAGEWVGTTARYRVCVNNSCITWPREIQTIERWAYEKTPGALRGRWFEFLRSGPGIAYDTDNLGVTLMDRGEACCFEDPVGGASKRYRIYASVPETTTTKFIVQGYDANGQWVRTQDSSGNWIDGEQLLIPTSSGTFTLGTKSIAKGGLVRVIKPKTNGTIRLFEYDTSDGSMIMLGQYEHDEEVPTYRRSVLPGLTTVAAADDCGYKSVTVMAKLRHIPVVNNNDFLIIQHPDAIRLECQAIKREEDNLDDEAKKSHGNAIDQLDMQLKHWLGSGEEQPITMEGDYTYGPGVENMI